MHTISILSNKKEIERTAIDVYLAKYLVSSGAKVCLLDLDFLTPTLQHFFTPTTQYLNTYFFDEMDASLCLQPVTPPGDTFRLGELLIGSANQHLPDKQQYEDISRNKAMIYLHKLIQLKRFLKHDL